MILTLPLPKFYKSLIINSKPSRNASLRIGSVGTCEIAKIHNNLFLKYTLTKEQHSISLSVLLNFISMFNFDHGNTLCLDMIYSRMSSRRTISLARTLYLKCNYWNEPVDADKLPTNFQLNIIKTSYRHHMSSSSNP